MAWFGLIYGKGGMTEESVLMQDEVGQISRRSPEGTESLHHASA